MRIALFVPCYVDQLAPDVGMASLELLERLGLEVEFPRDQTCCGQPFLTAGEVPRARPLADHFVRVFDDYDVIVTPSGSCAATVRRQLPELAPGQASASVAARTRELCDFLVEQDAGSRLPGRFPHRVGVHASCHALRELRLGAPSETREPPSPDPARQLLDSREGIELVPLRRGDECCGFGGLFSVREEAVSCRMGRDRIEDHRQAGAELVTSTDVSCLLHLGGLIRRGGLALPTLHVAELLVRSLDEPSATALDRRGGIRAAR